MFQLFVPLIVASAATLVAVALGRRLVPRQAAWVSAAVVASVFVTVWVTSWVVALGFLAHEPLAGDAFAWCRSPLGAHHGSPRWVGVPAITIAVWTTVRGLSVLRAWRAGRGHTGGVHVVDLAQPIAYAQTGAGGGVVVSRAMLDALAPAERSALFAHERAHLRHRHDRFLLVGTLGSGWPLLYPAVRQLRHALERWADEDAAGAVGDRGVVARAVARAALAAHGSPVPALAMLGSNVPARVEALMAEPTDATLWRLAFGGAAAATMITLVAATVQVHHLAGIITALCPT